MNMPACTPRPPEGECGGFMTTTNLSKGIYRRIYAGFIDGRRINAVPLEAEAWFWRLHALADDFGNFPANPARLWALTQGRRQNVTQQHVDDWVQELVRVGLIVPYEADGDVFYHIAGFPELQPKPNGKPVQKYPLFKGLESKTNPEPIQKNPIAPSPSPNHIPIPTPRALDSSVAPAQPSGEAGRGAPLRSGGDRGVGQGEAMVRYMLGRVTFPHVKAPAKDRLAPNLIDDIASLSSSVPVRVWAALQIAEERSSPSAKNPILDPVGWLVTTLTGSRVLQVTEADVKDFNASDIARVWQSQARLREGAKA